MNANEGLFDFILTDVQGPIGHFYCTQSNSFSVSKSLLQTALEKIEIDFSDAREEMPFILCGNFDAAIEILEYFEGIKSVFLLKVPSLIVDYPLEKRHLIQATQVQDNLGVLSTIIWQQQDEQFNDCEQFFAAHKNDDGSTSEDSVSYSAGYDREGKAYVEGSISHETRDQDGWSSSVELKGEVSRDRDGNTNASLELNGKISW